jgi:hypothetical protein
MKRKQIVTGIIFAAAALFPLAAWSQYGMNTSNFVTIGTSSLPAGQYLMSNLATGQSLFVVVNAGGQMLGQDPRALQVSINPAAGAPIGSAQQQGSTQPIIPGIPGTNTGNGFGGLLKQGLDSFINKGLGQPGQ